MTCLTCLKEQSEVLAGVSWHMSFTESQICKCHLKILVRCTWCLWIIKGGGERGFFMLRDSSLRRGSAVYSLSSLLLEVVVPLTILLLSSTEKQRPDQLVSSVVSVCSEPINDKERLAKRPSLGSGVSMLEWSVLSLCEPAELWPYPREGSRPDREALLGTCSALTGWGNTVPQSQTAFAHYECLLPPLPSQGSPCELLSPVAAVSPCAIVTSCALCLCPPSYFVEICGTTTRNCCFLHTEIQLKLLCSPFTRLCAPSFSCNWDS